MQWFKGCTTSSILIVYEKTSALSSKLLSVFFGIFFSSTKQKFGGSTFDIAIATAKKCSRRKKEIQNMEVNLGISALGIGLHIKPHKSEELN